MIRTALFAVFLALLPSPLFAASGDALSGSGATTGWPGDAESETVRGQRLQRTASLRLNVNGDKKADALYRQERASYIRKRAEHRRDCRESQRRANRDTRLPVLLRCYEEELRLELAFLELTQKRLEQMPGVQESVRLSTLSRTDLLIDAIDTVLFAIGSGVYGSLEDVMEARQNLLQRYRVPFWDALAAFRAGRAYTVAGAWIVKVDATRESERQSATGEKEEWTGIRLCLMARETALHALSQDTITGRASLYRTESEALTACADRIRALLSPPASAGSGATLP